MQEFWSSHGEVGVWEAEWGEAGEVRGLFERMVQWEADRRPSSRELLKHAWLCPFE